jgi:hypothetical protein
VSKQHACFLTSLVSKMLNDLKHTDSTSYFSYFRPFILHFSSYSRCLKGLANHCQGLCPPTLHLPTIFSTVQVLNHNQAYKMQAETSYRNSPGARADSPLTDQCLDMRLPVPRLLNYLS